MRALKDTRAVSPVIGVILMVAIVVVLAAIIAAFVFGMVGVTPPTPKSSIRATEARSATNSIVLVHEGGDTLALKDVQISVINTATLARDTFTPATDAGVFKIGDRLTINVKDNTLKRDGTSLTVSVDPNNVGWLASGDIIDVEIYHVPSAKLVTKIVGLSVL